MRSPTTTGKIERFHQRLRKEFPGRRTFISLEAAQEALDAWVLDYDTERPHQAFEMVTRRNVSVSLSLPRTKPPSPLASVVTRKRTPPGKVQKCVVCVKATLHVGEVGPSRRFLGLLCQVVSAGV